MEASSCTKCEDTKSYFEVSQYEIQKDFDMVKMCCNYEIYFVFSGNGKHIIDFLEYECTPNTIFFLSPYQRHHWIVDENICLYKIEFSEAFLLEIGCGILQELSYIDGNYLSIKLQNNQKCTNLLSQLYTEYNNDNFGKNVALRSYLVLVLIGIQRAIEEMDIIENDIKDNHIWKLKKFIRENSYKYETVEYYANKLQITPDYLNKLIKNYYNKTASQYIREKTILEAQRLLAYTNHTIEDIASILGFYDSSYFRKFFKRETNTKPNDYREYIKDKYPIKIL